MLTHLLRIRYGEGVEGFYNYLWDVHTQFPDYPIWVTEFGSTSTNDTGEKYFSPALFLSFYASKSRKHYVRKTN